MKINFNLPAQTRDGREVRIFTTNAGDNVKPVVGEICLSNDKYTIANWTINGRNSPYGIVTEFDLVNVPQKHVRWINIYSNQYGRQHSEHFASKEEADRKAFPSRVACIKIEFTEGEGIS